MKSRWLKEFEQEQRDKEEAERAAKAALEQERKAAALQSGQSGAGPQTKENADRPCRADRGGADIKPPHDAHPGDHAQKIKIDPQPSVPAGPQPTAVSASDPVAAERQELALAAEANAIAELADSASEVEPGLGISGLADVVVDSPPARRAPGEESSLNKDMLMCTVCLLAYAAV